MCLIKQSTQQRGSSHELSQATYTHQEHDIMKKKSKDIKNEISVNK